jgi:hypothetical protein
MAAMIIRQRSVEEISTDIFTKASELLLLMTELKGLKGHLFVECKHCGHAFEVGAGLSASKRRQFCSGRCRVAAWRARRE